MVYRIRVSAISWFVMADLANGMDALCNVCRMFYDEYEAVSVIETVLLIKKYSIFVFDKCYNANLKLWRIVKI